ncbi:hypothetical protein OG562_45295 [Streptomyces sp. NBC_01275]|uniref:hypothetical protein n=1 Tax=Streptomyces sp. NBC_01275 TaxID=2903807 RepID=UPI00224F7DAD|nr:hypothetical protein [Streptomyces sp. NBC_01275]MCX4768023.1 hypothetical protein [Streptomyces sp. NBC_01275]
MFEHAVTAHLAAEGEASTVFVRLQLAAVQMHLGNPRVAETVGRRWPWRRRTMSGGRAHAMWTLRCDAWSRGDRKEALAVIQAALEIERGFNEPLFQRAAQCRAELKTPAWIIASHGEYEQAGRLLGSAHTLWRDLGADISAFGPLMAEYHTQCEESVEHWVRGRTRGHSRSARPRRPGRAIDHALDAGAGPTAPATALSPLTRRKLEVAALAARA